MLQFIREWLDRSRALHDEREFREQYGQRSRQIVADIMEKAGHALKTGDRARALQLWREARAQYMDLVLESRAGLLLLVDLQQFDDAEPLMQEGLQRKPRNPFFLEGAALVATKRYDNEEAARRYATLRKRFPGVEKGYTDGIIPLIRLGRLDEADQVLGRVANVSQDITRAVQHARLAMTRKDWPVAIHRWQRIWEIRRHPTATLGIAECYKEIGRFDYAEQLLLDALKQPRPDSLECWAEMARIAEARGDWTVAARRWDDVRKRSPAMLEGYCRGALALGNCGRGAESESLLQEAMQRFASEPQPWIEYAKAAEQRGCTHEADARWEQFRVKFPKHRHSV